MLKLDHNPSQTHVGPLDQTWQSHGAGINASARTTVNYLLLEVCDDL